MVRKRSPQRQVLVVPSVPEQVVEEPDASTPALHAWLTSLPGAPQVHQVVPLACEHHDDEPATWSLVEADAHAGVARRRCLACGRSVSLLDSAERWTYPPTWSCRGCGQNIAELAVGLSVPDGEHVAWLALGARCVHCDAVAGLTDLVVPGLPVDEVVGRL